MRCLPLACIADEKERAIAIRQDVWATNPSSVALECVELYLLAVRMALEGSTPAAAWAAVKKKAVSGKACAKVLDEVEKGVEKALCPNRGYVCFSFYAAMWCLKQLADKPSTTYMQLMEWVIDGHKGSDTDTNAAIAGGLVGAFLGNNALETEPLFKSNWPIVVASTSGSVPTDVPRAEEYQLKDLDPLLNKLHEHCSTRY